MRNKNKKEVLRRLKIAEGHLGKVIKMVGEDKYCIDVLNQSLAVQNALKETDNVILDDHLRSCVAKAFQKKEKKEKAIKELLNVLRKSLR